MSEQEITQEKIDLYLGVGVSLICDALSDQELEALYKATSDGSDIKNIPGYYKAIGLFTRNDRTQMHEETKRMFMTYCKGRGISLES